MTTPRTPDNLCNSRQTYSRKRDAYIKRFGLDSREERWGFYYLSRTAIDQLDRCADDMARRLLLGIGRKR